MFGEQYAAIYAKVKSWMSIFIKKEELDDLIRANYSEFVTMLKMRVRKVNIQADDVVSIEGQLKQEGYQFLQSGLRFLGGNIKGFVDEWSKIYEIENLKMLTRAIVNKKKVEFLYKLGEFKKVQADLVRDIKTLDDLLEFLSGTDYYRLAQDSLPRVKEENNAFYFEMNLDNFYAQNLKKKATFLAPGDKAVIKNLFFYYLEMLRILWIFRAKFNYRLSSEEIIAMIPNISLMLSQHRYEKLLATETREDYIKALVRYKLIKDNGSDKNPEANLETEVYRAIAARAKKYITGSPFSLGVLLAFVLLQEINVRNLTVLLQSKKQKLDGDKVLKMLVI